MSFYSHEELSTGFDVPSAVNVRVKEAGMTVESLLRTYINGYEKFWQTPRTHGDRALTVENINEMLAAAPEIMTEIQEDGTAFVTFIADTHQDVLGTELFPARYLSIPYEANESGVLTTLKPEWEVQTQEEEEV